MREQKWTQKDKARRKKGRRKNDSGRSVFVIQQIQRDRARKIARKNKLETQ